MSASQTRGDDVGSMADTGLCEAPALAAGPGVSVVPVLGWRMSDGDAPGVVCRLLGIIVLRSVPPPQWVSVDGTRREYPVAEMSAPAPAPMTDLTAMAYTMDYRHDELVLSPRLAGQWPSIVVTSGGDVSRLR